MQRGTPMFGNVTALEGSHVTGKYRNEKHAARMRQTCGLGPSHCRGGKYRGTPLKYRVTGDQMTRGTPLPARAETLLLRLRRKKGRRSETEEARPRQPPLLERQRVLPSCVGVERSHGVVKTVN